MEMVNVPKMRPRTKHLNIKYHFFRKYVEDGTLQVYRYYASPERIKLLISLPNNWRNHLSTSIKYTSLVSRSDISK
jgi:hypothetical protein